MSISFDQFKKNEIMRKKAHQYVQSMNYEQNVKGTVKNTDIDGKVPHKHVDPTTVADHPKYRAPITPEGLQPRGRTIDVSKNKTPDFKKYGFKINRRLNKEHPLFTMTGPTIVPASDLDRRFQHSSDPFPYNKHGLKLMDETPVIRTKDMPLFYNTHEQLENGWRRILSVVPNARNIQLTGMSQGSVGGGTPTTATTTATATATATAAASAAVAGQSP